MRRLGEFASTTPKRSPLHEEEGIHLLSTDEKTSIQALERLHPAQPMRAEAKVRAPGARIHPPRYPMFDRQLGGGHGQDHSPLHRTYPHNKDFAAHIQKTIATDPEGEWIFVVDQLNIHQSEALVKLVAKECSIEVELDGKGNLGHIKAMASRRTFLQNPTHRIRFLYTPKHTSWLNQVELWFSIRACKLLKRGSFASVGRVAQADSGVHRVLQPNYGQTVQVDLQGPTTQGLNRWVIYTAML